MEQIPAEAAVGTDPGRCAVPAQQPAGRRTVEGVVPGGQVAGGPHRPPLPPALPLPEPPVKDRSAPRRHSVRAQVLQALRAALIEGALAPGEVYSAPALAARYGVSATPVREAMQQLTGEGAVETVPNRGFRVAEHSAREAADLAEVRALLEVPVVLRLARTLPAEQWRDLRPQADATVREATRGDRAAHAEADRAFHRALLELSGNRQLVLTAEELHWRAQCASALVRSRRTADLLADASEHVALLEALERRELATAERVIREHFTGV